jgi:hypothetical protein
MALENTDTAFPELNMTFLGDTNAAVNGEKAALSKTVPTKKLLQFKLPKFAGTAEKVGGEDAGRLSNISVVACVAKGTQNNPLSNAVFIRRLVSLSMKSNSLM